jgi:16S rRNA (guanine1516-N2)-methyltransferase
VIYLDPMFPHREKTALVKKEMRLFRPLVGDDPDAPALLQAALASGDAPGGGQAPAQGAVH